LGLVTGLLASANFSTSAVAQTASATNEGYTLLNRGWVNDAIVIFQRVLRSYPNSLEARLGLAIAYQKAGQDSAAWKTYHQVLNQDPNNRAALKAIGLLGGYRPEWQPDGIAALTALLQLNPNDTDARAQRALLYGYQGKFAKSLADYQPLLQSTPKPEILLGAAQIYAYSGKYAQGIVLFKRYQATGKPIPDDAVAAYATALRQTGQAEQAVQLLEARLQQRRQLDPTAIQLRAALAVAYQMNNQPKRATATLFALHNQPEAALPLARATSEIARQTKNTILYQEAISLYRQVLQKTSDPPPGLVIEVADVMSESSANRAEALQLYQQAIQQQPDNAALKIKQLILTQQLGQISRADSRQQLRALLQPLPASQEERQLLAQALQQLDPPDPELLSSYQELAQSDIDVPFLNIRIAQILIQKNELEVARQVIATYRATSVGSQDLASELFLAEIERRENRLDNAAQRYESIIARNPNDIVLIDSLRGLAGIRQAQGRVDDALQIYDRVLSRNPQATWAQLGKASLDYQAKRMSIEEAESVLNQWLTAQPTETPPELFSLVGALPPDPKRESLYSTLLIVDPDSFVIQRRLIQVLARRDPQQARSRVNQLLQGDPTNLNVYFVKAELAQTLGNFNEAAVAYQEILQRQPENVDALLALGGVRFQQQRYGEAEAIYKRIVALKPTDWDIRRILAELSLAQDQPQGAIQQFKQAEQLQKAQGSADPVVADRLERVQVDYLRRRGFQPSWERY
ncbi:MAG: tetratricopeptide repeat protein, partial [Kovacikia sp.]